MAPSIEEIMRHHDFDESLVERISKRTSRPTIAIVEPNPEWPAIFSAVKARIEAALGTGDTSPILQISHVGSTSVPGLPAKDIIDVDLTVRDIADESSYAPQLEAAGFQFLLREPHWHRHRLFGCMDPWVNLHVWPVDCPEAARHLIFREWLVKSEEDRRLYERVKRECAAVSAAAGETQMEYNLRKEYVIREILLRAFKDLGYPVEEEAAKEASG